MRDQTLASSALALTTLLAVAVPALAGSFSVYPMRLALSAKQPVASLEVHNNGSEPAVVQLQVVDWTQADDGDVYGETSEVLATPPILTVPPGGSRVVRVGLRRNPDAQHELSYRLYMQELPPPQPPEPEGMRMTLRIGVPVFVAASAKAKPEFHWRSVATSDGGIKLSLANGGNEHIKIRDLELSSADGAHSSGVQNVTTYVLSGQHREWLLKMDAPLHTGVPLRVKAHTDGNFELEANLTLEAT